MARSGWRARRSFCSVTSAGRVLATRSRPDVSLSRRWTSSRNSPGRAAPHLLDHAEALAAAAVDGDAGRLVDADDRFVLVDDGELAPGRFRSLAAIGDSHRRDPNLVAEGEPGVGGRPALVDPHFTRTDDAVHVRARHALQDLGEEVVETLAVRAAVDADVSHERGAVVGALWRWRRRYARARLLCAL